MKKKLTENQRKALKLVKDGADVYAYPIAVACRQLEKLGLIEITKPMMPMPSGEKQQPYFGAIAKRKA